MPYKVHHISKVHSTTSSERWIKNFLFYTAIKNVIPNECQKQIYFYICLILLTYIFYCASSTNVFPFPILSCFLYEPILVTFQHLVYILSVQSKNNVSDNLDETKFLLKFKIAHKSTHFKP